jgi:predicted NodU family carbamoyl transferase
MTILGLNTYGERSSACSISSMLSLSALCSQHSGAFIHNAMRSLNNAYDSLDTVVTHQHSSNEVRSALPRGVRFERVDYCEALSMATIASTDWSSCAILLSDSYYTRLGYYVDGAFYWIREFEYPNSIALFSAAVTRFLGYDPTVSEDAARRLAMQGNNSYIDWICTNAITLSDGSYQLLHNLERGFGSSAPNADIAASAQIVFSAVLVSLAAWLRNSIDIPRLAVVGRSAANYITNTAIAELTGYEQIAAISVNGAAATALGCAALIRRPLLEHHYIATATTSYDATDIANKLLRGELVKIADSSEFSDNAFLSNNYLMLPFTSLLKDVINKPTCAVCQDIDYSTYFSGHHKPYFGQFICAVKNKKALALDEARVITVSKNKNPLINRVLEITRAQGYPIIVSTPVNEI